MTSSSSLSKVQGLILSGIAVLAADAVLLIATEWVTPVSAAIGLMFAAALLVAAVFYTRKTEQALRQAAAICAGAAEGDLEARIPGEPEAGTVGLLHGNINFLLDITDAFVREASGSMQAVSRGRYHRKVLLRGLPGSFRNAAMDINRASDIMEAQAEELRAYAGRFEDGVGSVVENVTKASADMRLDAERMSRIAAEASDIATTVSAATEQTSANVQTVATATEELSTSVAEIGRQVTLSSTISQDAVARAEHTNAVVQDLAVVRRVAARRDEPKIAPAPLVIKRRGRSPGVPGQACG